MIYRRSIQTVIDKYLKNNDFKTFFIWGPRRSGKTTILKELSRKLNVPIYNFDYQAESEKFIPRKEILEKLVKNNKAILIDEVQNYPESTIALKLLHDEFGVKVIATGSSELRQKSQEFDSLAGRYTDNYCLPLSINEIKNNKKDIKESDLPNFLKITLEKLQIFGSYPEIYSKINDSDSVKVKLLKNIVESYVLKDIINIYELKNQKLAREILIKIALQLGNEVSIREIANSVGSNAVTVSNYIEIFIKNYILIPLPSFGINARRSVSKNRKLYFYDLGIRNALVNDFRDTKLRPDAGGVFENFIISEIEKQRKNMGLLNSLYFYREYGGKEIDLVIEDYKKNYKAIEIKARRGNPNKIFPIKHKSRLITEDNYFNEITKI